MFSGLQGYPSASGHGGGYPDGKDLFIKVKIVFCSFFPVHEKYVSVHRLQQMLSKSLQQMVSNT